MIVTFDECYDNEHKFLILGALFASKPKKLHEAFLLGKRNKKYIDDNGRAREIKYTLCNNHYRYGIGSLAIDCFIDNPSFFRAIVVDQRPESGFTLEYFGKRSDSLKIKEARAYKKFAELLLKSSISEVSNARLLADRLTRCQGDAFIPLMTELFGTPGAGYSTGCPNPIFRHIQEIDTALEQYHIGQIGDILQGVILNELIPTKNQWKRKINQYVKTKLGIPSLMPSFWNSLSKWEKDLYHPKFQVWYWSPNKRDRT